MLGMPRRRPAGNLGHPAAITFPPESPPSVLEGRLAACVPPAIPL